MKAARFCHLDGKVSYFTAMLAGTAILVGERLAGAKATYISSSRNYEITFHLKGGVDRVLFIHLCARHDDRCSIFSSADCRINRCRSNNQDIIDTR
jgi:hypothetical protein